MEKYQNIIKNPKKRIIKIIFPITMLFSLMIALTAILSLTSAEKQIEYTCIAPYKNALAQWQIHKDTQSIMKSILLSCASNSTERKSALLSDVEENRKNQQEQLDLLKYSIANSTELNSINALERLMEETAQAENEVIELSKQKDVQGALSAFESSYAPASQKVLDLLEDIGSVSDKKVISSYENVQSFNNTAIIILVVLTVLNLVISTCLYMLITRLLKSPIT